MKLRFDHSMPNKCLFLTAFFCATSSLYLQNSVLADTLNPGVFGINESPYGKTYEEWTKEWWQWLVSIPSDLNPSLDRTGENCDIDQGGSVFKLTGTGGGTKEVNCEIPSNMAILFPVIAVECSFVESPALKTETDLHDCATSDQDSVTRLSARINGIEIRDIGKYRLHSGLFNLTFPDNNIFGVQEGQSEAVSDGYWVFLKPLTSGSHLIEFSATLGECTVTSPLCLSESSTYHLEVK